MSSRLAPTPRRIIVAGWLTYVCYYLGRLNLSAALSLFTEDRGLTGAQTGLIFTGFFWAYAVGGFGVGWLTDRISPSWLLAGGLLGSGLINLAFPLMDSLWLLVAFWSLNGFAQSAGWTPLIKMVASLLDERQASEIAGVFGTSFVVGTSLAWTLGGVLAQSVSVDSAFVVPGAILSVVGGGWILAAPKINALTGDAQRLRPATGQVTSRGRASADASLSWTGGSRLFVVAATMGFGYIALLVWTPIYFSDVHGLSTQRATAASALLPLLGIVVIRAVTRYQRRTSTDRNLQVLGVVTLVAGGLFILQAAVVERQVVGVAVFVLAISAITAAASLLLGQAPVVLAPPSQTGQLSGRIGLFTYLGGGAGAGVIGAVRNASGWPAVFLSLGVATLAAGIVSFLIPTPIDSRIP